MSFMREWCLFTRKVTRVNPLQTSFLAKLILQGLYDCDSTKIAGGTGEHHNSNAVGV